MHDARDAHPGPFHTYRYPGEQPLRSNKRSMTDLDRLPAALSGIALKCPSYKGRTGHELDRRLA